MTKTMEANIRENVQVFKEIEIEIEKSDGGVFYLTNGFMAIVAKRFITEQSAINYARKVYGKEVTPRYVSKSVKVV